MGSGAPTRRFDGTTAIDNPVGYKESLGSIRLSFEDGEAGEIKIQIPFRAILTRIRSIVTKALADTDSGVITFTSPDGDIAELEHAISAAQEDEQSEVLNHTDDSNLFEAGDDLTITTAKATPGGKVAVDIDVLRVIGP